MNACPAEMISADRWPFQAAHRLQPGFQPPVIGFYRVVRVALDGVPGRGDQLVQDPRIGSGTVGSDLGRDRAAAQRAGEEPPGRGQVALVR